LKGGVGKAAEREGAVTRRDLSRRHKEELTKSSLQNKRFTGWIDALKGTGNSNTESRSSEEGRKGTKERSPSKPEAAWEINQKSQPGSWEKTLETRLKGRAERKKEPSTI